MGCPRWTQKVGAVTESKRHRLHPITMSDFVVADITDAMLDGLISGFPNTYATKVGKTSDKAYKSCFGAFMSMHCSSLSFVRLCIRCRKSRK